MNKLAPLLLTGLCALALLVWYLSSDPVTAEPGGTLPGGRRDPAGELHGGGGDPRRQPVEDRPGARTPGGRSAVEGQQVSVHGRCIDAATQAPIAGCEVRVGAQRARGREDPGDEVVDRTGPDGRFALKVDLPPEHNLRVRTSAPLYADMTGYLRGGRSVAVGDIAIPRGAFLEGRVVSQDGAVLPETSLHLTRVVAGGESAIRPHSSVALESDAGGQVRSSVRLACQTWLARVTEQGLRLKEPESIEVTDLGPVQRVDFVVELPDPKTLIRGRVVDGEKAPVAHAVVHARDEGRWPVGFGFTDTDGRFVVRCRKEPGPPVRLAVPQARGHEPLLTQATYPWGSDDVTLVLAPTTDLRVVVHEAGSQTPVERYAVSWQQVAQPDGTGRQQHRGRPEHHPEGRAVVEGLPAGPARIMIVPDNAGLAPNEPLPFVKGAGPQELRIELQRRTSLPVQVRTAAGAPVAGTRLELLRPEGSDPVTLATRVVDHGNIAQLTLLQGDGAVRLDQAKTDAQGRAVLRWVASPAPLAIKVTGDDHVTTVHQGVVLREGTPPVEIVVETGATLQGRLVPLDVLEQLRAQAGNRRWRGLGQRVELRAVDVPGVRPESAEVDAQGGFVLKGLRPGTWEVRFSSVHFGLGRGATAGNRLLDTVRLGPGQVQQVRYDISELRPARLRGRVTLDGAPAAQQTVQVTLLPDPARGGPRVGRSQVLQTDDTGSFDAVGILPGRYAVSVEVPDGGRRRARLTSAAVVDVPPGGDVSRDFSVMTGSLRVQLNDADGKPAAGRLIQVADPATGYVTARTTGADGWMEIEKIAAGTYRVRARAAQAPGGVAPLRPGVARPGAGGSLEDLGDVVVRAGAAPTEARFSLPKK